MIQVISLSNPLWVETLQKLRHDIYHLPEYLALESERIAATPEAILIVDGENIFFIPYLLRQYNNVSDRELAIGVCDVVSPYGYPGILLSKAAASTPEFVNFAMSKLIEVFRVKHVCSAFLRLNPLLNKDLNEVCKFDIFRVSGETVSVDLTLSEAEIWCQTRGQHRNRISKCKRDGFIARIVPLKQYLNDFIAIYEETMDRVGAAQLYYFSHDYFLQLADTLGEKIHLCIVEIGAQAVCAGLFTECCGIVQCHLSGTRTEFLQQAPSKLMLDYVRFWAKERGNEVFHLGGGVGGAKDSLYHFKAGFSKQRHSFLTLRIIADEKQYSHLVDLRAKSLNTEVEQLLKTDFFPAYRSSS